MGLFGQGKKKDPKELVREWNSKLRKEGRQLDRQILSIKREEDKIKKSLKDAAKKGHKDVCTVLAKEVVRSRKAQNKIYTAKAQIKSVEYGMNQQLATLRVSGCLEKSAQVMASMNQLIRVQDVQQTMMELSKEMMKAGIIEEMMEDTMEMMEDGSDELEEEAQEEVDKVLFELTAGELGKAPAAVDDSLPETSGAAAAAIESSDEETEEMQARLEALRT